MFDYRTDRRVEAPVRSAPSDAILLFDGIFVHCGVLRDCWDGSIFVDAPFDVTLARGVARDGGDEPAVRARYEQRYLPAQRLYLEECRPRDLADAVVDNADPARPGLRWRDRA